MQSTRKGWTKMLLFSKNFIFAGMDMENVQPCSEREYRRKRAASYGGKSWLLRKKKSRVQSCGSVREAASILYKNDGSKNWVVLGEKNFRP